MFIDTHAHLYLQQFDTDKSAVVGSATKMGVQKICLPNIDSSTTKAMIKMEEDFPDICYACIGLHPCYVKSGFENEIAHIKDQLESRKFYGIGETGIDLHWDKTYKALQIKAFEIQILLAIEYDLPIIIHSREALDLTIELIAKHQNGSLKGIFHCFNGTIEQCKQIQDLGFHMGLGGGCYL